MTVNVLRDEQFTKEYEVTLAPDAIQTAQEAWIMANAKDMRIDGFRPGKAPMPVLMTHYGDKARDKAVNKILADQHKALCDANNLKDARLVSVQPAATEDKFKFLYEVPPQFDLIDPKSITVENLTVTIDDKAVEKTITTLRREEGGFTTHKAEEDYAIQDGDVVIYEIAMTEGETPVTPNKGKIASSVTIGLEDHEGYKLVADKIKGHKMGETVTVENVQLKNMEGAWACANGKTVNLAITIEAVTSVQLSELNEDFFAKFMAKDLDELKEKLRTILASQHTGAVQTCHKRYIFDALDTAYDFDVDTKAVEQEYDRVWAQFLEEQKEYKEKGEEHPDMKGKTLDGVKDEYMKVAERRIRLTHILSKTAEKNKINLNEGDVTAYANDFIRPTYPRAVDLWGWRIQQDENFKNEQLAIIHENKIAQFLHNQATHQDVTLTAEKLSERLKDVIPE